MTGSEWVPPVSWECETCHEQVTVRHYLQRDGVIVHDPDAAYREAAGLDPPEPPPPGSNASSQTPTERTTSMGITDDRNHPGLSEVDPETGMQAVYLTLSEDERAKGFVRPLRRSYRHLACGAVTTMGMAIAETYARQPLFYGGTYCATCRDHFPVGRDGEFVWDGTTEKVGT